MMEQKITARQREAQASKLFDAKQLLKIAIAECNTATPDEISQTIDVVLEILTGVNQFLKSRKDRK